MKIIKDWFEHKIPDGMDAKLVNLVLNTPSMDSDEKQYWFDIYGSMNEEQKDRLFDILETERIKLDDLEKNYQAEIRKLNLIKR